jgi:hypothetical protein
MWLVFSLVITHQFIDMLWSCLFNLVLLGDHYLFVCIKNIGNKSWLSSFAIKSVEPILAFNLLTSFTPEFVFRQNFSFVSTIAFWSFPSSLITNTRVFLMFFILKPENKWPVMQIADSSLTSPC